MTDGMLGCDNAYSHYKIVHEETKSAQHQNGTNLACPLTLLTLGHKIKFRSFDYMKARFNAVCPRTLLVPPAAPNPVCYFVSGRIVHGCRPVSSRDSARLPAAAARARWPCMCAPHQVELLST